MHIKNVYVPGTKRGYVIKGRLPFMNSGTHGL